MEAWWAQASRAERWAWATYPLGVVIGMGMLAEAMRKLAGASTTWRGTTYASPSAGTPPAPVAPAAPNLISPANGRPVRDTA